MIEKLFSLEEKTALVTGASRGLGQAMAIALADAGANVICAGSRPGSADETAGIIEKKGRKSWSVFGDLSSSSEVEKLAEDANSCSRTIDILVNNAGTIERFPAAEYPTEAWERVIQTNLNSVYFLSRYFGAKMIERKQGKIVNTASLLSFSGGITVPSYAASKHAVAGLTKALANEWAVKNIQVNAIAPGYFKTDNTQALQNNKERFAEISARIPASRWGIPEDLSGAVIFLSSKASDYVNGHILTVDGGWMAR
ncbi:SDR family NAD(P)-dependent oxidoreductase [Natronogracilivirga saccharolytica]|uniref:SDR family oxidoreductase n=1 Tax=Natronogracilivirga saccharolytica TaxID=2812953 RepID=A0A8J7RM29_9BACT|nr:SDR family NAD(P)-dependent oxidoreductase [Natronogracilivirga saccharolytica]MBP3193867.1 SDR family oxidoreductase [Natronogracilivirga saccharolytica]